MSKHPWSVFVIFAVFILVVGTACSSGAPASTSTPEPLPTAKPLPTAEPKPTSEPTQTLPTQTSAPTAAPPFELDSAVYTHPSGTFSFNPPVGWTPKEGLSGVVFTSPDGKATLDFSVTNTGTELDIASFENFVKATEANYFSWRPDYTELGYKLDDANASAMASKSFTIDGVSQAVFTLYLLNGQGAYSFDFWSEESVANEYSDPYSNLMSTINVNSTKAADLPAYNFVTTFTDQNNLFQFDVPLAWTYAYNEDKNIYFDTFTSPDGHGAMQNLTYDDGTTISKSLAGKIALALLNQSYTGGAGDIKITGDVIQKDGSERLDWTSKKGGYSGQSFFEARGKTTFLMLSQVVDEGYFDLYQPVFQNTLSSYVIP
jgi:hypothetical protein